MRDKTWQEIRAETDPVDVDLRDAGCPQPLTARCSVRYTDLGVVELHAVTLISPEGGPFNLSASAMRKVRWREVEDRAIAEMERRIAYIQAHFDPQYFHAMVQIRLYEDANERLAWNRERQASRTAGVGHLFPRRPSIAAELLATRDAYDKRFAEILEAPAVSTHPVPNPGGAPRRFRGSPAEVVRLVTHWKAQREPWVDLLGKWLEKQGVAPNENPKSWKKQIRRIYSYAADDILQSYGYPAAPTRPSQKTPRPLPADPPPLPETPPRVTPFQRWRATAQGVYRRANPRKGHVTSLVHYLQAFGPQQP